MNAQKEGAWVYGLEFSLATAKQQQQGEILFLILKNNIRQFKPMSIKNTLFLGLWSFQAIP
jgi:hypothetical protein